MHEILQEGNVSPCLTGLVFNVLPLEQVQDTLHCAPRDEPCIANVSFAGPDDSDAPLVRRRTHWNERRRISTAINLETHPANV